MDRESRKNPHAVALGRLGGKVKSEAKTRAARRNVRKRWKRAKLRPGVTPEQGGEQ
jgi:hypothetical protein